MKKPIKHYWTLKSFFFFFWQPLVFFFLLKRNLYYIDFHFPFKKKTFELMAKFQNQKEFF